MVLLHSIVPGAFEVDPAMNVAIGLRHLGVPAAWIGRIGDDSMGARITPAELTGHNSILLKETELNPERIKSLVRRRANNVRSARR